MFQRRRSGKKWKEREVKEMNTKVFRLGACALIIPSHLQWLSTQRPIKEYRKLLCWGLFRSCVISVELPILNFSVANFFSWIFNWKNEFLQKVIALAAPFTTPPKITLNAWSIPKNKKYPLHNLLFQFSLYTMIHFKHFSFVLIDTRRPTSRGHMCEWLLRVIK